MENTLFVHVGPHKTGTTLIQKYLMDNRAQLYAQGMVYPKRFQSIFAHHTLRHLLFEKSLSDEDIELFNEPHNFLVSSEDFISLEKSHWEYFQSLIKNKRIVILYTWRRASLKLYSIWQETIKHGATESFFSYYHDHIARPGQSLMLSADLKLNMLSQVFGIHNIRILDYETCVRNDNLCNAFLKMANIEVHDGFVKPERNKEAINKSMELEDIEILRVMNHHFKDVLESDVVKVKASYLKNIDNLTSLGLETVKHRVSAYCRQLKVGNYYVDNRCEKVMSEKYRDNIVNYEPNSVMDTIKIARDEWIMSAEIQAKLQELALFLRSVM